MVRKALEQKFEQSGGNLPVSTLVQKLLCDLFEKMPAPHALSFSDVAFTFTYRTTGVGLSLSANAAITHSYTRETLAECGFAHTFHFTASGNKSAKKLDPKTADIAIVPGKADGRRSRSGKLPDGCEPLFSALRLEGGL